MALQVTPTNIQKIEYDVTTSEGATRVTIVFGSLPVIVQGFRQTKETIRAWVDPTLQPGKFRRAIATASFRDTAFTIDTLSGRQQSIILAIDDVQATYDDDTGKILLEVDVTNSGDATTNAVIQKIGFQVTTLAMVGTGGQ